jgi:hypothetical protein
MCCDYRRVCLCTCQSRHSTYFGFATSQVAKFTFHAIMSSGDPSASSSTPPSTSVTVATESKLETAIIQRTYTTLSVLFPPDDDDFIKENLTHARHIVYSTISKVGGPNLKECLRYWDEFDVRHVKSGSKGEHENLSNCCEVWQNNRCRPGRTFSKMVHCFSSL